MKMGFYYWFRVIVMVVSFVVVVWIIHRLNQGPIWPSYTPATQDSRLHIDICPTRVTRLEIGHVAIFEKDMDWMRQREGDAAKKLEPVDVEKWFSRHCQIAGSRVNPSADVHEALKVFFVSGEPQVLLQSAGGDYEWMGEPFRSHEMDEALRELSELPIIK
jgi:hypothetical protein